jgi:hypothetical protein
MLRRFEEIIKKYWHLYYMYFLSVINPGVWLRLITVIVFFCVWFSKFLMISLMYWLYSLCCTIGGQQLWTVRHCGRPVRDTQPCSGSAGRDSVLHLIRNWQIRSIRIVIRSLSFVRQGTPVCKMSVIDSRGKIFFEFYSFLVFLYWCPVLEQVVIGHMLFDTYKHSWSSTLIKLAGLSFRCGSLVR